MPLTIDVVSDVVCPWCFIGKRRLEGALALYAKEHPDAPPPTVTWRPFQLNPACPPKAWRARTTSRTSSGRGAAAVYDRVSAVGREVGIDFAFDRIARQPNTLAAHSLIELAGAQGRQDATKEAFFRAYFLDGVDLTARENLVAIATSAGLDRAAVEEWLDNAEAARGGGGRRRACAASSASKACRSSSSTDASACRARSRRKSCSTR